MVFRRLDSLGCRVHDLVVRGAEVGLRDDLVGEVAGVFTGGKWEEQAAYVVPAPESIRLNSNHAKQLKAATVLYADLDGSTSMVDSYQWWFAAEVYKAFLRCASQIIRHEGGTIVAYDGDRVMAIFTGDFKNTTAVKTALKINYAVSEIIRPAIKAKYTKTPFLLKHVVGIDTSELYAARIGIHRDNDLVWVGRAANYAAKLCSLPDKPIWITKAVFDAVGDAFKPDGVASIWQPHTWNAMNKMSIYASTYYMRF
jgi:class 3 adenylate cyclase